ncbi:hypothetical protein DFP72DRAFT_629094 [Ephemerocybe angulata]|uniref:Uncharacterized protein n=1 Tax=Ephemerocybe angulata TaxID=980116 RepID=A0A8H6IA22_9AGAR|nr:hypothetical protein DFP72DRAFT_629094 [Tulosesus angulatus]
MVPSWPKSVLVPSEYSKDIPLHITQGVGVDSIAATEDNLVIFLEAKDDTKFAHVLTFGVPPSRSDKGKDATQSMINTNVPLGP